MAILKLLALVFTAVVLVPSAAHLFEMPGKISLERDAYFTVQAIYAGWSLFAVPIFAAILANLVLSGAQWRMGDRRSMFSLLSAVLIASSLVVFFIWVFPGNQQTANWTSQPENWELLRRNWEYGHASNAVIVLVAFVATSLASIGSRS
ncbi:hypothetical protein FIU93_08025 [Labrenzia sp. THAF35]|uniref:DUF1772 domain-containing protein n=1 Tax=Labrenzia sp. THAF35 TaxID=2587854 RepID=UPI0012688A66|nr:DUF1772 domain-containing protein [Labrenzia sp. THAF35]QFT66722.1 hypothetical protein FIU93_08025 [Labrenzia sp. THAF35]